MDQISRKIATSSINEKLKKAKRLQAAKIYKRQRRNDPITGPLERAVSKYRKRIKRIRKGDPDFEKFKGKGLLAAEARRLAMEELGIKDMKKSGVNEHVDLEDNTKSGVHEELDVEQGVNNGSPSNGSKNDSTEVVRDTNESSEKFEVDLDFEPVIKSGVQRNQTSVRVNAFQIKIVQVIKLGPGAVINFCELTGFN